MLVRRSLLVVVLTLLAAATPLGAAPAEAQTHPPQPITIDPPEVSPGGTVRASGRCGQTAGTFQVRLAGPGGSSAVTVAASTDPTGLAPWTADLPVPWSVPPGSVTISTTCATPGNIPTGVSVPSGLPPAPFPVQVFPRNGHVRVAVALRNHGEWYFTAISRRNGQIDRMVTWSANDIGTSIPAPNGEPVEITVYATNRNGVSAASQPVTTAAVASGPAPTVPPAPSEILATGSNAGRVLATWNGTAGDGGAPILGYSVAVAPHGSSQLTASTFVGADVRAASLDRLAPGSYDLYVAAVSELGYGAPAAATVTVPAVTTSPTVPWTPADLSVQHRADGLAVGWRPTLADGGSPIVGYAVVVVQHGVVVAWQNAGPNSRAVVIPTIRGPQPPTIVYVLAANRLGFGVPLTAYTGG